MTQRWLASALTRRTMTQRLMDTDSEAGGHPMPEVMCFESWWEEGGTRVFANIDYHVASQECVARCGSTVLMSDIQLGTQLTRQTDS